MFQKKSVEDFQELHNTVEYLSAKIPVPEPLISYQHSLTHQSDTEEEEEEEQKHHNLQSKNITISADIYKYRSSKKERAFVPNIAPMPKPQTDFLALDMEVEEKASKTPKFRYRPVKIKMLPLNPEKIRRKELKKRKK